MKTATTSAARTKYAPENTSGPISRLKPALPAASFSSVAKVGPSTAPSVPVHTTMEIARARRSGRARSAATYRPTRLAAWPAPIRNRPTTKSGNDPTWPAVVASPAPTTAVA